MSITSRIRTGVSGFPAISLDEVQQADLMQRKDRKYLFGFSLVPDLLQDVAGHYRILEIDGRRIQNYQTFYYDTPGLTMYHLHHSGRVNRHKIRFRKYGTSEEMYFEVKKKDARGVTIKNRMQTESREALILSREEEFLSVFTPYDDVQMIPVLENSFDRITLVSPEQSERITLDYHLWFSSPLNHETLEVPGISIAEIKFSDHLSGSLFNGALRHAHVIPSRFSKYCIGMAMLNPALKQNLFKDKVRRVRKINTDYKQSNKK
jgi:hypothetical protein